MININDEFEKIHNTLIGFCTPAKARNLYDLMISEKPKLAVEVGVYGGRSLLPLALGAYRNGYGRVVGIDLWTQQAAMEGSEDEWTKHWNGHDFESKLLSLADFCRREPYASIVELKRKHLVEAADDYDDESIGLFHEDGNHSREVTRASFKAWLPKVKPGGIVIWDDPGWNGDKETEDWVVKDCGLKEVIRDDHLVLRKL